MPIHMVTWLCGPIPSRVQHSRSVVLVRTVGAATGLPLAGADDHHACVPGPPIFEFIWECLRPDAPRAGCATVYDYGRWPSLESPCPAADATPLHIETLLVPQAVPRASTQWTSRSPRR